MNALLKKPTQLISGNIQLSGSKSLSNRVLIIQTLSKLHFKINNLSDSDDTKHLQNALEIIADNSNETKTIDVGHAGTDMRFLTALLAITNGSFILTGSERLQQRPIKPLVSALLELGADINYLNKEGFPPLKINGKSLQAKKLSIESHISSQFISAILMIAPYLKNGLELKLVGSSVSVPYINMTVDLMKTFGSSVEWNENLISIKPAPYNYSEINFNIESDWSSASYYYSLVALSPIGTRIQISTLQKNSLQSDSACSIIYNDFGVETVFNNDIIELQKKENHKTKILKLDFITCPDIAQTIACTCLALNRGFVFTGLQTLVVKETNRIEALKNEFLKFNKTLHITESSISFHANEKNEPLETPIIIDTYNDHRMAMAFAPLCLIYNNLQINNADVVSKSYPTFWEDLKDIGIPMSLSH